MKTLETTKKGINLSFKLTSVLLIFFIIKFILGFTTGWIFELVKIEPSGKPIFLYTSTIIWWPIYSFLFAGALGTIKDQITTEEICMSRFITYGREYFSKVLPLLFFSLSIGFVSKYIEGGDNINLMSKLVVLIIIMGVDFIIISLYPIIILKEDLNFLAAVKQGLPIIKSKWWDTFKLYVLVYVIGGGLVSKLIIGILPNLLVGMIATQLPIAVAITKAGITSYMEILGLLVFMLFYVSLEQNSTGLEIS